MLKPDGIGVFERCPSPIDPFLEHPECGLIGLSIGFKLRRMEEGKHRVFPEFFQVCEHGGQVHCGGLAPGSGLAASRRHLEMDALVP